MFDKEEVCIHVTFIPRKYVENNQNFISSKNCPKINSSRLHEGGNMCKSYFV